LKFYHRLVLYPLIFLISFFVGLQIKNVIFNQKTSSSTSVAIVSQNENTNPSLKYLYDPLVPQEGFVNLTKDGYYFVFNYTYNSSKEYCINGTIFSIKGGTYKVRGCSWENTLDIKHLEKEIESFGFKSLLDNIVDLIFFTNKLIAENRIKVDEKNKAYIGFLRGNFSEEGNCYKIILKNSNLTYIKEFCPISK